MRRAVAAIALAAAIVLFAACGDDGDRSGSTSGGDALSQRVEAVLAEQPDLLDGRGVDDVTCPDAASAAAGDRATCVIDVGDDATRVEVDIEFDAGGAFRIVAVNG